MLSKLLFLQDLIDFDADWNSNHRLLFHVTELTPGSNLDAVKLLGSAIAFWVRNTGIGRWVLAYSPEIDERARRHLKLTNDSWKVDETYIKVKGEWKYLYRAEEA